MYLMLELVQWVMAAGIVWLSWSHRGLLPEGMVRFAWMMFVLLMFLLRGSEVLLEVDVIGARAAAIHNIMEAAALSSLAVVVWGATRPPSKSWANRLARRKAGMASEVEALRTMAQRAKSHGRML
jgi:hypothetical protein